MSAFRYNSTYCNFAASQVNIYNHDYQYARISFRNLAIDGSGAGSPAIGMNVNSTALSLRDVLIENVPGTGLKYVGGFSDMDVANSAFIKNQTGMNFAGEGSLEESTLAGNTATGLVVSGGNLNLTNDTITGNTQGFAESWVRHYSAGREHDRRRKHDYLGRSPILQRLRRWPA